MQNNLLQDTYKHTSLNINIDEATPMLKQFVEIKKNYQGIIIFYRMGDFYETFLEDAVIASSALGITLTSREAGRVGRIAMAGVPVKSSEAYIQKLIIKGYKVAICEQVTDPSESKGLVDRRVVKTITAGTITESSLLESNKNNYLAALVKEKNTEYYGLAYIDITTSEFRVTRATLLELVSELSRISPSEIIAPLKKHEMNQFQVVPEETVDLPEVISKNYCCTKRKISSFDFDNAVLNIKTYFKVGSLESFGLSNNEIAVKAAGAVLDYLEETQLGNMPRFDVISGYTLDEFVSLDPTTQRNLELVQTVRDNNFKGSLLWAVDKTCTNMGARLLRKWILQPLKDIEEINLRQSAVEELLECSERRSELTYLLKKVYDVERLSVKITNNSATPRDFLSLKQSLTVLPEFGRLLYNCRSPYLAAFSSSSEELLNFANIIDRTILESAPVGLKEGNMIKSGISKDLDYYRELLSGGKEWLERFEQEEREKTGIKTLKISYSKNFGFFIEITNSNKALAPERYIRKQTLTNAERYVTEELKKHETEVLSSETKSIDLEYQIFVNLREYANEFVPLLMEMAKSIAILDVLLSFATLAKENNYVRPEVNNSLDLLVEDGRHPVIEKLIPMGEYTSNSIFLSADKFEQESPIENIKPTQFMILTGPNMSGKSTYMRQNALIVILAQIGSFVPAKVAKIGIVDKIFTRVGAVDDLSTGQSTFMVEMNETALILNSATNRSFIILDEIGRGTSTYDGVAIAWSVSEHIAEQIGTRTIFATHYHELNIMQEKYKQIENYKILVAEKDGNVEFLHRVVLGGTSRSYGIQVAKMAGLPNSVISRAQSLMNKMQKDYTAKLGTRKKVAEIEVEAPQLSLFLEE